MKEADREKLVAELTAYVYQMAPHQKERMGGRLILRAVDMLKTMRVSEDPMALLASDLTAADK